jgi:hypothetical protein
MVSLRTKETEAAYAQWRNGGGLTQGCPLCRNEPLRLFTHWKVIVNDFPYDKVAEKHHMLVPLRHVAEGELTAEEKKELFDLKPTYLNDEYQFIIEATHKTKSVPEHFHLHLIIIKEL